MHCLWLDVGRTWACCGDFSRNGFAHRSKPSGIIASFFLLNGLASTWPWTPTLRSTWPNQVLDSTEHTHFRICWFGMALGINHGHNNNDNNNHRHNPQVKGRGLVIEPHWPRLVEVVQKVQRRAPDKWQTQETNILKSWIQFCPFSW